MSEETKRFTSLAEIEEQNNKNILAVKELSKVQITPLQRNIAIGTLGVISLGSISVMAISALTTTAALGGIALIGGVFYYGISYLKKMDPIFRQKMIRYQQEAMEKEAKKHAVSYLESYLQYKEEQVIEAKRKRDKIGGIVRNLKGKINFDDKSPATLKKIEMYETLKKASDLNSEDVDRTIEQKNAFAKKLEEYKTMQEFTEEVGAAFEVIGEANEKLKERLSLAAFNQIDKDFNETMVSIENRAKDVEKGNI